MLTRRGFFSTAGLWLCSSQVRGQTALLYASSRPDVAAIDHDRILRLASAALTDQPTPLTSLPAPRSPGSRQDFYSESTDAATSFTAHRDAVMQLSRQVAALAAAFQLTHQDQYAMHAAVLLRSWFVDPATRMNPSLEYGGMISSSTAQKSAASFQGVLDTVFFAELALALPVLFRSGALNDDEITAIKGWFGEYLQWLTTSKLAGLARDQKDHHGSSWLLQATSYARLTENDAVLTGLSHHFKAVTLRAQILADGSFPHELATDYPYRNSLFNLELLAAVCELLSSRFENLWEYELQDGPGLHVAMSRHYPSIEDRASWPYKADLDHFMDLPARCSSLLFAARAYSNPEYAALWKALPADTTVPEIDRCLPISQPLLWIGRVRN